MKQPGFSLMEMMIVLLIMSIIAAATAPIVSKKMSKSASSSNANPWVFIDTKGNAAFNMAGKDVTAVIGASKVPTGVNTRLYIDCGSSNSQLTFGKGDEVMQVTADPSGRAGISSANIPEHSVAFGSGQTIESKNSVTIGQTAKTAEDCTVAIGNSASANKSYSTALGTLAKANGAASVALGYDSKTEESGAIAIGPETNSKGDSVAIGNGSVAGWNAIAIGGSGNIGASSTVSVENLTKASANKSIAIGYGANSTEELSLALGSKAKASKPGAIAIGSSSSVATNATGQNSIAIGSSARALGTNSVAIGASVTTNGNNVITLGTADYTVFIPGNLVVGKNVLLNGAGTSYQTGLHYRNKGHLSCAISDGGDTAKTFRALDQNGYNDGLYTLYRNYYSDRRLKNVGNKYTDGLEALKKLDFYHYTYKKDEAKTPHVGVIAQDLQKVFPSAVTKDEKGFLKIRIEDMFYAVINAIKELDSKNHSQDEIIANQQKIITELQKQNQNLIERIEKLEK